MTLQDWIKVLYHFGIDPPDVYDPTITHKSAPSGNYAVLTFKSMTKRDARWTSVIINGEVWRMHGLPGKITSPIPGDTEPWYKVTLQRA